VDKRGTRVPGCTCTNAIGLANIPTQLETLEVACFFGLFPPDYSHIISTLHGFFLTLSSFKSNLRAITRSLRASSTRSKFKRARALLNQALTMQKSNLKTKLLFFCHLKKSSNLSYQVASLLLRGISSSFIKLASSLEEVMKIQRY